MSIEASGAQIEPASQVEQVVQRLRVQMRRLADLQETVQARLELVLKAKPPSPPNAEEANPGGEPELAGLPTELHGIAGGLEQTGDAIEGLLDRLVL